MDKQQTILHMDMHAAAMKCMAVASTGLDRATRALDAVGSPGSRAALQLDLDALMQSLMRRPLSHFLAEVSQHRKSPHGPHTRLNLSDEIHTLDASHGLCEQFEAKMSKSADAVLQVWAVSMCPYRCWTWCLFASLPWKDLILDCLCTLVLRQASP